MIQHFTAHKINCVCQSIRSMFRVLGIYNFGHNQGKIVGNRFELTEFDVSNLAVMVVEQKKSFDSSSITDVTKFPRRMMLTISF